MDLLGTISLSFPGSSRITHRPHINITLASCVLFTIVVHNPRTDHRPWASVNSNSDDRNSQVDYPYGSYNARTCPPSPTLALATNDDDKTRPPATPTLASNLARVLIRKLISPSKDPAPRSQDSEFNRPDEGVYFSFSDL
jgi:hypothetical protein